MPSSFLKTLAGAFIEFDDDNQKSNNAANGNQQQVNQPAQQQAYQPQPQQIPVNNVLTTEPASVPVQNSEISEAIIDALQKKLEQLNRPGPDYLEFKGMFVEIQNQFKEFPPDAIGPGVFRRLKAQYPNLTLDMIVSSIDEYINDLNNERNKGKAQYAEQRTTIENDSVEQCKSLKAQKTNLNASIDQCRQQIKNLEEQIAKYNTQIAGIDTELLKSDTDKQQKINDSMNKEQIFENSVNYAINILNTDKTNISKLKV